MFCVGDDLAYFLRHAAAFTGTQVWLLLMASVALTLPYPAIFKLHHGFQ
jgi:hypothetical protein